MTPSRGMGKPTHLTRGGSVTWTRKEDTYATIFDILPNEMIKEMIDNSGKESGSMCPGKRTQ